MCWDSGDPGFVIIDKINNTNSNPTPNIGKIKSTNPALLVILYLHRIWLDEWKI